MGSTYDLRVGVIIAPNKTAPVKRGAPTDSRIMLQNDGEKFELPPKGIAWIVSLEDLKLPGNVTGHVDLVNEMSRKGLLAFNTGVIDPTYNGPISTVIINFSEKTRDLVIGERFFRVTFMEHGLVDKTLDAQDRKKYITKLVDDSRQFPSTFLDLDGINDTVEKSVTDQVNAAIPKIFPMITFVIGLSALVVTMISIIAAPIIREILLPKPTPIETENTAHANEVSALTVDNAVNTAVENRQDVRSSQDTNQN